MLDIICTTNFQPLFSYVYLLWQLFSSRHHSRMKCSSFPSCFLWISKFIENFGYLLLYLKWYCRTSTHSNPMIVFFMKSSYSKFSQIQFIVKSLQILLNIRLEVTHPLSHPHSFSPKLPFPRTITCFRSESIQTDFS